MAPAVANMVAQQSSVTGTGDRALDGAALANCRVFSDAFAAGDVVHATILDRTTGDTEVGVYVVRASPSRLEVQSVRLAFGPNASGGPTSPVSFVAGTKDVLCDVAAEDVRLGVLTLGANTFDVDFDEARVQVRVATGAVTIDAVNYAADREAVVVVENSTGGAIAVTAVGLWTWLTDEPTTLAAGEVGVLSLLSVGTVEADCLAAWAVQV